MIKFSELPISSRIVRAVRDMGFETATEIQEKAIPIILQGRDVLGKSLVLLQFIDLRDC